MLAHCMKIDINKNIKIAYILSTHKHCMYAVLCTVEMKQLHVVICIVAFQAKGSKCMYNYDIQMEALRVLKETITYGNMLRRNGGDAKLAL